VRSIDREFASWSCKSPVELEESIIRASRRRCAEWTVDIGELRDEALVDDVRDIVRIVFLVRVDKTDMRDPDVKVKSSGIEKVDDWIWKFMGVEMEVIGDDCGDGISNCDLNDRQYV